MKTDVENYSFDRNGSRELPEFPEINLVNSRYFKSEAIALGGVRDKRCAGMESIG